MIDVITSLNAQSSLRTISVLIGSKTLPSIVTSPRLHHPLNSLRHVKLRNKTTIDSFSILTISCEIPSRANRLYAS